MDRTEFRRWAAHAASWAADYLERVAGFPVRAQTKPGAIHAAIPAAPPEQGEPMAAIFADLDRTILPGITHWQHPRFFAYFPANSSPPSVLAEIVTATLAAQCMLWQTSPAATELEVRMIDWLRQMIGLPAELSGVIQDSATTATFAAILAARERALGQAGNRAGLAGQPVLRVYASTQAHSSVEKAVRMAGIGSENLVQIAATGPRFAMDVGALDAAITADRQQGRLPIAVVGCLGGTSIGACDDLSAVAAVARRHGLYVHVDAAWAGAAMICPEHRHLMQGAETVDSLVFNPHKWLFTNFDCSAHFVRDPRSLTDALGLKPAYLRTLGQGEGAVPGVTDFNEWSVPLGRRFRALKLWFVIRSYGVEALREKIRSHIAWSRELAAGLAADPAFEVVTPPMLSLFTFRHVPPPLAGAEPERIDAHNAALLQAINDDGRIYLTQTTHAGRFVIRFQVGQTDTTRADVQMAGAVIRELAGQVRAHG